jgi:hypothetical protein
MKGRVKHRKDVDRYYVQWGTHKVYRYKGHLCRDGEVFGLTGEQIANKLLALIQNDFEANPDSFRIEKYTEQRVDTIPYLREWLEAIKSTLSPATYKDYLNSINNHLIPWFKTHPYDLHEIRYDTLCSLLSGIKREGKGKLNVMYCLRVLIMPGKREESWRFLPSLNEGCTESRRKKLNGSPKTDKSKSFRQFLKSISLFSGGSNIISAGPLKQWPFTKKTMIRSGIASQFDVLSAIKH